MSPRRVSPGDSQSSQPSQPAAKQPTSLEAQTVKGHLLSGLHATGKCRLTSKGKPVAYEDVDWFVGDSGECFGTSQTDEKGCATMEGGSTSDIFTSITGEFAGYFVKYHGNEQYLPSEAHGHVVPLFSIL